MEVCFICFQQQYYYVTGYDDNNIITCNETKPLQALQQSVAEFVPQITSFQSVITKPVDNKASKIMKENKVTANTSNAKRNHACPYEGM